MALMMMRGNLGLVCKRLGLCQPLPSALLSAALPRMSIRAFAKGGAARGAPPPPPPPAEEEEEGEGEYDFLDGLTAAAKRRVYALKDEQKRYDEVNRDFQKELASLQAKYQGIYGPIFDERKEIVAGAKAVGKFDIEDDNEPDAGVTEFWLTAFSNHDKVGPMITERDAEVLKFLEDVRYSILTGDDRGFKLVFDFKENPYFSNTTLEKTYVLEAEDDIVPKQFIGCKIDWKQGQDVTVEQVKKRVKSGKNADKAAKAKAFVTESVPCDSFFNVFDPPQIPEDPDSLADEAMDELQDALTTDFDIGYAIKDQIIPRAVEWFTGEIAPMGDEDYYGDEGDEYADEEEEEPPRRR